MKELKFRVYEELEPGKWELLIDTEEYKYFASCESGELFYVQETDASDSPFSFEGEYKGENIYKICQFTGFNDKNNVNIFEGDILEVAGGTKIIVNDLAEFLIYCGKYEEKHGVELFPSVSIVGNIYES